MKDAAPTLADLSLDDLIVCPTCDAVHRLHKPRAGERIDTAGNKNAVSILDAALAFSGGFMIFLSLATAALIIFIPLLRALLTLYVLVPLVLDRAPARHAIRAFRLSEALRPWSMAEIFAIGCAVALVKITDLATVTFGPAFWMFGILVVLVIAKDNFMCKWSVWNALEHPKTG